MTKLPNGLHCDSPAHLLCMDICWVEKGKSGVKNATQFPCIAFSALHKRATLSTRLGCAPKPDGRMRWIITKLEALTL